MDMDRDVEMLRGKTTRSKLILACIALDLLFFIFMAISGAGPLANRSLFWIGYNRADLPVAVARADQFLTGMWGNCRVTNNVIACYQWNYDPIFPSIYGYSIFYAIMSLQVLAGCILFFGGISIAFLNPFPLFISSLFATVLYIPAYAMIQWVSTNIGQYLTPYESWNYGPSMICGTFALVFCLLSTLLKAVAITGARKEMKEISLEREPAVEERKEEPMYPVPPVAVAEQA